ncbi:hypothetical protein Pelo_5902 [Pelomyxa schiedti]|nr:hypothetical protein Pelo_5902 [Pelomyxa schiedti]
MLAINETTTGPQTTTAAGRGVMPKVTPQRPHTKEISYLELNATEAQQIRRQRLVRPGGTRGRGRGCVGVGGGGGVLSQVRIPGAPATTAMKHIGMSVDQHDEENEYTALRGADDDDENTEEVAEESLGDEEFAVNTQCYDNIPLPVPQETADKLYSICSSSLDSYNAGKVTGMIIDAHKLCPSTLQKLVGDQDRLITVIKQCLQILEKDELQFIELLGTRIHSRLRTRFPAHVDKITGMIISAYSSMGPMGLRQLAELLNDETAFNKEVLTACSVLQKSKTEVNSNSPPSVNSTLSPQLLSAN